MPFVDNFICFCGEAMFESFLEPHMKDLAGASQFDVSMAFLTMGAMYMVSCTAAGYVSIQFKLCCFTRRRRALAMMV